MPILRPVEPVRPPSGVFWGAVAVLLLVPLLTYVPSHRGSLNLGLASLQPTDVQVTPDPGTKLRLYWAMRLASPKDGGARLAPVLGRTLVEGRNPVEDLSKRPDPMAAPKPAPKPEASAAPVPPTPPAR